MPSRGSDSRPGPGAIEIDKLQVERRLGRGAGSELFVVRDTRTGKRFALKVVQRKSSESAKYIDQALHEIEVAQKLDHPNLVKFFSWKVKRGWFGFGIREVRIAMEYADGVLLQDLDNVPLECAVAILLEIARALEHMHGRGIYHADLKPTNVIVTWDGRVKVFDYGLAWLRGQQKDRIQGTRGYLAPEQVTQRVVNARTDIFNFGMLAYRFLTGTMRKTGAAGHSVGIGGVVLKDIRELRPDLPKELAELVTDCLKEKPAERPPSMTAVRERLEAVAAQLGVRPDTIAQYMRSLQDRRQPWAKRSF